MHPVNRILHSLKSLQPQFPKENKKVEKKAEKICNKSSQRRETFRPRANAKELKIF